MDFKLGLIILSIWVIMEIFIARWMFKAKPGKDMAAKYPRKVIFLSQLPFGKRWKKSVDARDLKVMEKYQWRITIWYLMVIIPFFSFFAYLYLMF